jgi:hypothetical protein
MPLFAIYQPATSTQSEHWHIVDKGGYHVKWCFSRAHANQIVAERWNQYI